LRKGRTIIQRINLIDKIVEEITNQIIQGKLKEGEKLPSQGEMAKSMGVSRGTLREAFNQLVQMGIIDMKQGSGTYVRSVTPSAFMKSLAPALLMDKSSAKELLDARIYIEGAVASLAAKKATKEDVDELRKALEGMRAALGTGNIKAFVDRDVEFHILIGRSTKNRVLMKVVETIREILYEFITDFFTAAPDTTRTALSYHAKIYKAIEHHDEAEARKQMESHMQSLIRMMDRAEGKTPDLGRTGLVRVRDLRMGA